MTDVYDDIVIGAGSAGAVVASRLSEDPSRRVLLLESGSDYPTLESLPETFRGAHHPVAAPGLNWHVRAQVNERGTQTFDYAAGRLTGGSSAINAVQALRGTPDDFEEWSRMVGGLWGWQDVLPFFRALETDPIASIDLHGDSGPLPIAREPLSELRVLPKQFLDVCLDLGYPSAADHNDPETLGVGVIPKNVVGAARMSTALTYLAQARSRPNLRIVDRCHVAQLVWRDSKSCEGVLAQVAGGDPRRFSAQRVILCAGAFQTPALLQRSGIGDPALLESLRIEPRIALRGVGQNFMDHPVVCIWAVPAPGVSAVGDPMRQTLLRYTSRGSAVAADMHLCVMAGVDVRVLPPHLQSTLNSDVLVGVSATVMKSRSRGHVRIVSGDPHVLPQAVVNCLADARDLEPLREGVELAWQVTEHRLFRPYLSRVHAWTSGMVRSPVALDRAIKSLVRPSAHACGTAAMGLSPEAGAVVDREGRIFGVDNLWIADASIMPTIVSAPTNLTTIMIGEKIAHGLKHGPNIR